jgi:hypothetical protein
MASSSNNIIGNLNPIRALGPVTPSTSTPTRISLKNALGVTVVITGLNATTVTGSAITLKQSTAVAGTGEKALSFDTVWQNIDTATADGLAKTAVSSDTFTTTAVNSKGYVYVIEVPVESLDTSNGFDCFRVGTGDATATTLTVNYFVKPRSVNATGTPTLLTD